VVVGKSPDAWWASAQTPGGQVLFEKTKSFHVAMAAGQWQKAPERETIFMFGGQVP